MSSRTGALREALAAEHAAVYAYGVVGGVLDGAAPATAAYTAHRARRDLLTSRLRDQAVPAQPAYELPFPVKGPASARRLAVRVEQRCAEVYAAVVADTTGRDRLDAAHALGECAVRAVEWGGEPQPFPGLRNRS